MAETGSLFVAKAEKVLRFSQQNVKSFLISTKELLYKTDVRPILEYVSAVWDPQTKQDIDKLQRVQNLVAWFVSGIDNRDIRWRV